MNYIWPEYDGIPRSYNEITDLVWENLSEDDLENAMKTLLFEKIWRNLNAETQDEIFCIAFAEHMKTVEPVEDEEEEE